MEQDLRLVGRDSEIEPRNSAARVRGGVASRIVGDLVTRLAGGESWEFAAFNGDDTVVVAGASSHVPADVSALRAEVRLQRFGGAILPHVGVSLATEQRRSLSVVFGEFGHSIAILRVVRQAGAKPFASREFTGIERFFRRHADAVAGAIFDSDADESQRIADRRAAPIAFTINTSGALLSSANEIDEAPGSLRTHLTPRNGEIPAVLRPVIGELLERHADGVSADKLVCILPFALVRLTALHSQFMPSALLVTVEWLRSRASLEVTAAHYSISKRELQVLSAMLRGAPVMEIAAELSISESTVVFHLKRMLKKTSSKNRTELAARMLGWKTSVAN